jgi:hypothetical protein
MHKAKGNWASLKAKRPIDEDTMTEFHSVYRKIGIFIFNIPYSYLQPVFSVCFYRSRRFIILLQSRYHLALKSCGHGWTQYAVRIHVQLSAQLGYWK